MQNIYKKIPFRPALVIILIFLGDIRASLSQFTSNQTTIIPIPHPITSIFETRFRSW